jgi:hypothetical protein
MLTLKASYLAIQGVFGIAITYLFTRLIVHLRLIAQALQRSTSSEARSRLTIDNRTSLKRYERCVSSA